MLVLSGFLSGIPIISQAAPLNILLALNNTFDAAGLLIPYVDRATVGSRD